MAFEIRRNRPYVGAVTLTKVGIGSFNAKEIVVSEAEFLAKFSRYFDKLSAVEVERLRRAAPPEAPEPVVTDTSAASKPFKLRKAAATG